MADDITTQLTQLGTEAGKSIFATFLDYIYIIGLVVLVGIVLFIFLRALKRYTEYAGSGEKLGSFCFWIKRESQVTGNLSINTAFREEWFNKIKKVEAEFGITFDAFKQLISDKKIYIYDFKVTDHGKAWSFETVRTVKIIATEKVEMPNICWQDKKGRFNLTSVGFREYPKNVPVSKHAMIYQIRDPWGKEVFIWYLPIERDDENIIRDPVRGMETGIVVNHIAVNEDISKAAELLPTLIRITTKWEVDKQTMANQEKMIDTLHKQVAKMNAKLNKARLLLNRKMFVGHGKPQTPIERAIDWAFILGAFIIGAISYGEVPKLFTSDTNGVAVPLLPNWFVAGIGLGLVIVLKKVQESRKPLDEQIKEEGEVENAV